MVDSREPVEPSEGGADTPAGGASGAEMAAHDVVATLEEIDGLVEARVHAETRCFVLAAHFADLHPGEALAARRDGVLPGIERAVRIGGRRPPTVSEFAAAELGGRLRMGPWAARSYLADALDTRHRLPRTWARVVAGQARLGWVRLVAARTRHLCVAAADDVDASMVDFVDGCLPWGRFEARLAGRIVAADPDTAAARERARAEAQFARRTRSVTGSGSDAEQGAGGPAGPVGGGGIAGFYVRSTIGVVARLDATVAYLAEALREFGDADPLDLRRVKALLVLANPTVAVELLAAYRALRARTLDVELPLDPDPSDPAGDPATHAGGGPGEPEEAAGSTEPMDALERMNAFARRVGFDPHRLPTWLFHRPPDDPPVPAGADETAARAPGEPPGHAGGGPRFGFDWSRLLPPLTLYLHLSVESLLAGKGGVVRWEDEGPITEQFVHDHLRPLHAYRIQPVIDLPGMAPADAYELPDRHRQAVRLVNPADCFPFAATLPPRPVPGTPAQDADVDHNRPYHHPQDADDPVTGQTDRTGKKGQSALDNLGMLGRFHHRVKTHGSWTVRQPFAGIYVWRDPHGQIYLSDHTGTHRITRAGAAAGPATN